MHLRRLLILSLLFTSLARAEDHGDYNRAGVVWTPYDDRRDFVEARKIIDEIAPAGKDTVFNIPKDRYFAVPKGSWFYPKPVTGWRPSLTDWSRRAVVGQNPTSEESSEFAKALDRALEKIKNQPNPEVFLFIDSHGEFGHMCLPEEKAIDLHHLIDVLAKRVEVYFPGSKKDKLVVNVFYGACNSDSITWAMVDEKWGKKRDPKDLPKINWITQSAEDRKAHGEALYKHLRDYRCKNGGKFDTKDLKTHGPRFCLMDETGWDSNDYKVQSNYQKIRSTVPAEELFGKYQWVIEKELHHLDNTDIPFLQKVIRENTLRNRSLAWQALAHMKHSPDIVPFLESQLKRGGLTASEFKSFFTIALPLYLKHPKDAAVLDTAILEAFKDFSKHPGWDQHHLAMGIKTFPFIAASGHDDEVQRILEDVLKNSRPHISDGEFVNSAVLQAASVYLEINGKESWLDLVKKAKTRTEKDYYETGRVASLLLTIAPHDVDPKRDRELGEPIFNGMNDREIKETMEKLQSFIDKDEGLRLSATDALRVAEASYPHLRISKKSKPEAAGLSQLP